jgi:hypothetical protein
VRFHLGELSSIGKFKETESKANWSWEEERELFICLFIFGGAGI